MRFIPLGYVYKWTKKYPSNKPHVNYNLIAATRFGPCYYNLRSHCVTITIIHKLQMSLKTFLTLLHKALYRLKMASCESKYVATFTVLNKRRVLFAISGFRHQVDELCGLLVHDAAYSGNSLPTFREISVYAA